MVEGVKAACPFRIQTRSSLLNLSVSSFFQSTREREVGHSFSCVRLISVRPSARLKQACGQPTEQLPSTSLFRRLEGADLAGGSETSSEMGSRKSGAQSSGPGTPPICRHPCLAPAVERLIPARRANGEAVILRFRLRLKASYPALLKRSRQGTSLALTFHTSVG